MTDDQKTQVKTFAKAINSNVVDGELLDFVVDEVNDRVLLYLNDTAIADNLLRVIARVVASVFNQTNTNIAASAPEQVISSVSDNGQSVSYSQAIKSYLATSDDDAIFSGFAELLQPYRRLHVITS